MAKLRLVLQLIDDDGGRHESDVDIPISDFKDPDLVNEEDRLHAFTRLFGFLLRGSETFVKHWALNASATAYSNRLDQYARDRGLGEADRMALMVASLSSEEGTKYLQLPLGELKPEEGRDIPRPGFPSRYQRKPVI